MFLNPKDTLVYKIGTLTSRERRVAQPDWPKQRENRYLACLTGIIIGFLTGFASILLANKITGALGAILFVIGTVGIFILTLSEPYEKRIRDRFVRAGYPDVVGEGNYAYDVLVGHAGLLRYLIGNQHNIVITNAIDRYFSETKESWVQTLNSFVIARSVDEVDARLEARLTILEHLFELFEKLDITDELELNDYLRTLHDAATQANHDETIRFEAWLRQQLNQLESAVPVSTE